MNQQFESAKPLAKQIAAICHQNNTNMVFYALIDMLAGLVVTHIQDVDAEIISQEVNTLFKAQIRNYQVIKANKSKRVRRKRAGTFH